jgi:putative transposase
MKDVIISIPELEFGKYKQYFIKEECHRIVPLFRQVRIVPKFNGAFFNVELIYEKDELNKALDVNRVASLDFGVDNLITLVDNKMGEENREPIIINGLPAATLAAQAGKPIKSINQFYNKKRAEIQADNGQRTSKEPSWSTTEGRRLMKITDWRNEKISDYMHKTSRFVINYCVSHNLGHIVIGKNDGWKQSSNISKRNNQNFVAIPFDKLIQQIQYKGGLRSKLLSVANTVSRH